MHFIDGADGGYAVASAQLSAKRLAGAPSVTAAVAAAIPSLDLS
jgi:hypothetical protein